MAFPCLSRHFVSPFANCARSLRLFVTLYMLCDSSGRYGSSIVRHLECASRYGTTPPTLGGGGKCNLRWRGMRFQKSREEGRELILWLPSPCVGECVVPRPGATAIVWKNIEPPGHAEMVR